MCTAPKEFFSQSTKQSAQKCQMLFFGIFRMRSFGTSHILSRCPYGRRHQLPPVEKERVQAFTKKKVPPHRRQLFVWFLCHLLLSEARFFPTVFFLGCHPPIMRGAVSLGRAFLFSLYLSQILWAQFCFISWLPQPDPDNLIPFRPLFFFFYSEDPGEGWADQG